MEAWVTALCPVAAAILGAGGLFAYFLSKQKILHDAAKQQADDQLAKQKQTADELLAKQKQQADDLLASQKQQADNLLASQTLGHQKEMDVIPHMMNRITCLESANQKCSDDRVADQRTIGKLEEAISRVERQGTANEQLERLADVVEKLVQESARHEERYMTYTKERTHDIVNAIPPLGTRGAIRKAVGPS